MDMDEGKMGPAAGEAEDAGRPLSAEEPGSPNPPVGGGQASFSDVANDAVVGDGAVIPAGVMVAGRVPVFDPVGIVAIGRNEGERLQRCLESATTLASEVVYVDSGSTDASVQRAHHLGADVVCLDMSRPFTAARARNEGFLRLTAIDPSLRYVQFVDGDCEIDADWIPAAKAFLDAHPDVAAVCGRRREKYPERSVYNLLCDLEWNTPVGEAQAFGGDVLIRVDAFRQVGGFRGELIAGEEPELCVRLRSRGWRIWRLDHEMTRHDAAMTRFGQWWRRTLRGGYAYAEGSFLHGHGPARHWLHEARRAMFWGGFFPLAVLLLGMWFPGAFLLLLAYPLQVVRLAVRRGWSRRASWWQALFLVLAKFPECIGEMKFLSHQLAGRQARLVEYI